MKGHLKLIVLMVIPLLFLIFFKETYYAENSISFMNALTSTEPPDNIEVIGRTWFSVYNENIGIFLRIYLATCIVGFLYTPAILHVLRTREIITQKKSLMFFFLAFGIMFINVTLGVQSVGEYFYFYQSSAIYFVFFLYLVSAVTEVFKPQKGLPELR